MKYFIDGHWYTELGRRIKLNDCLNNLNQALKEYTEFHNLKKKKRKRKSTS